MLNGLVLERLEVAAEVAIFKVDNGRTNQVITEEQVIIPHFNLQKWATREDSLELVHLVDVRRGFICLIVVSVASDFLTKSDLHERIRWTIVVSCSQIESTDDVDSHVAL